MDPAGNFDCIVKDSKHCCVIYLVLVCKVWFALTCWHRNNLLTNAQSSSSPASHTNRGKQLPIIAAYCCLRLL